MSCSGRLRLLPTAVQMQERPAVRLSPSETRVLLYVNTGPKGVRSRGETDLNTCTVQTRLREALNHPQNIL